MKLRVNQKVKVILGNNQTLEGFIYKLDHYAKTYSVSADGGLFYEFNENDLGKKFDLIN